MNGDDDHKSLEELTGDFTRLDTLEKELDQLHSQCCMWVGKLREARELVHHFKEQGPAFKQMQAKVAEAKKHLTEFLETA